MIIAIDGPAASGKGTIARRVAKHFGYQYLDTGALYRAVARDTRDRGFRAKDRWAAVAMARSLDPATLEDSGLREQGVGDAASIVAKLPEVRAALLDYQRRISRSQPGAVLDGRDIGTVVCPWADVKLFIQATPEERARRRFLELQTTNPAVREEDVLELIRLRDARDAGRENAPMRVADDAYLLDTTDLDIEAAVAAALEIIARLSGQSVP